MAELVRNPDGLPEAAGSACSAGLGRPTVRVRMFKMTYKSRHFNANQKVWIKYRTGACAALCVGKYRGKWGYVSAWVRWTNETHPVPTWIEVEVPQDFATRHGIEVVEP